MLTVPAIAADFSSSSYACAQSSKAVQALAVDALAIAEKQ